MDFSRLLEMLVGKMESMVSDVGSRSTALSLKQNSLWRRFNVMGWCLHPPQHLSHLYRWFMDFVTSTSTSLFTFAGGSHTS